MKTAFDFPLFKTRANDWYLLTPSSSNTELTSVYDPTKICFRASEGYILSLVTLRLSMAELSFKDIMGFVIWDTIYEKLNLHKLSHKVINT